MNIVAPSSTSSSSSSSRHYFLPNNINNNNNNDNNTNINDSNNNERLHRIHSSSSNSNSSNSKGSNSSSNMGSSDDHDHDHDNDTTIPKSPKKHKSRSKSRSKSPGKHKSSSRSKSRSKSKSRSRTTTTNNNGWWDLENDPELVELLEAEGLRHKAELEGREADLERRRQIVIAFKEQHLAKQEKEQQRSRSRSRSSSTKAAPRGRVQQLIWEAKQKERANKPVVLEQVRANPITISNRDTFEVPSYGKKDSDQKAILKKTAKKNFLLHDLATEGTKADVSKLLKAFEPVEYASGKTIVRQGSISNAHHMYVVEKGTVEFQVDDVTVATGGVGTTFGERNLLFQAPAKASVIAAASNGNVPIKLFRLHQETYRGILQTTDAKKSAAASAATVPVVQEEQKNDAAWLADSKIVKLQKAIQDGLKHIAMEELERIKVLGEGQFGEVWLVAITDIPGVPKNNKHNTTQERHEFALKLQQKQDEMREDHAAAAIRNEVKAMQELPPHPFLSTLYKTYESEESIDMLLGLIPGGELWDVIHKENEETGEWLSGIPEPHAAFYSLVVADTLGFMHSKHYIFRDLKPENIMIDAKGYPVIVDFGFAKKLTTDKKKKKGNGAGDDLGETYTFCGTPNYVAPEIVKNSGHNAAADYWALGIVIYEMIAGENPFYYDDMEQMALYQAICEEPPEPLDASSYTKQVRKLVDKLLMKDPTQRLGMKDGKVHTQDILDAGWYEGLNLKKLRAKKIKAPWIPGGEDPAAIAAAEEEEELERQREEAERQRQQEEELRKLEREEEERRRRREEARQRQAEQKERRRKEEAEEQRRQQAAAAAAALKLQVQKEREEERQRQQKLEARQKEERERLKRVEEEEQRREEELRKQQELEEQERQAELQRQKEEEEEEQERQEELRREKEAEEERLRLQELQRKKEEEEERLRQEEIQRQEEEEEERLRQEEIQRQKEEEEEERRRQEEIQRQKEEEEERLRQEELQRQKEEEEERLRLEEEEEAERQRQEEEQRRLEKEEAERQRQEELRRQKKEEEERLRLEEEQLRKQQELEEEQRRQEEEEEEERKRREEEGEQERLELEKKQKEEEKQRKKEEKLKKQKALEKKKKQKEKEALEKKKKEQEGEAELSMDDVFDEEGARSRTSSMGNNSLGELVSPGNPTRKSVRSLHESFNGFASPGRKSPKRNVADLVSPVPKGIVAKMINSSGKKSPGGTSLKKNDEAQKSVRKGLVAQRLSKAKKNDKPGNVPSLFSSFSLLDD